MAAVRSIPSTQASFHPFRSACDEAMAAHASLRARMHKLDAALSGLELSPLFNAPWAHFTTGLQHYFDAEEGSVFPALLALSSGEDPDDEGVIAHIQGLQGELDTLRTISDALRAAAIETAELERPILELLDDLEAHTDWEEENIFPLATALLNQYQARASAGESAGKTNRTIRHTRGVCHTCLKEVPAEVTRREDIVRLDKHCSEHGITSQVLSYSPDYWEELDRFYFKVNRDSWPQRDYIVRMTERCNLDCPICLAKANTEETPDLDLSGLEDLLNSRRGIKVDLMAAEPTLREDLEDWIRKVKATGNIAALHTNGLKLANRKYAQKIKDAGVDEVFLQFDGFDENAHMVLRGRPLLKARMATIKNLRELDIATSLIVVIAKGLNEDEVAKTYQFALKPENSHIREVFFLGLRVLGSARDAMKEQGSDIGEMTLMPDQLIEMLCSGDESIQREDIRRFNKLYFALLSAFKVKKCLYVQHYLMVRNDDGTATPISKLLDLPALDAAAEKFGATRVKHPLRAKALLLAALARHGTSRETAKMLIDLVRLQMLFKSGMNLKEVPNRFLLLGFITACDPHNFDAQVAINCGKGELSVDGGYVESGAVANVNRESRFDSTDRRPGELKR